LLRDPDAADVTPARSGDLVTQAGAGRVVRGVRAMVGVIGELASDPGALALLRAGSRALARPSAAAEVADLIAAQASVTTLDAARDGRRVMAGTAQR
jgi:UDP-N-acetylglucosamine:LPS N-acetylglucosamine transferase